MLITKENEILTGSENEGFTHYCWLYEERIILKDSSLFLELKNFDVEKEEYVLSDASDYEILINEHKLRVNLEDGLGKLQIEDVEDITILGKSYYFKNDKWYEGERESFFSKILKRK